MINRHLTNPSMTTATVMGTLAMAPSEECAGDNHQDPMVMAHSAIHARVMARLPPREGPGAAAASWADSVDVIVSPHDVEQTEDGDPEQIDHVPVGGPLLDHRYPAKPRVAELANGDTQDQQSQCDVKQVGTGEHVVEREERDRTGISRSDLHRPFVGLDRDEQEPAGAAGVGQPNRLVVPPGAHGMHAACHEP